MEESCWAEKSWKDLATLPATCNPALQIMHGTVVWPDFHAIHNWPVVLQPYSEKCHG
jgi:hypothetical protein